MEFIVSRNRLLKALQHARCAICKGDLNVLKCFVLTFDDEERLMTVHASDGSMWIEETVVLDAHPVQAHPIAVWYSDLLRSVKSLDEQPLKFTVGEYQLKVTHSCGSFRLPLSNTAEEFLNILRPMPDVEAPDGYSIDYEAPGLASVLSHCAYAMAKDELRPSMNGVYLNLTSDFSDYVASDGHKLVRVRKRPVRSSGANPLSFIIPAPVVRALRKILPSTGDVTLEYQDKLVKEKTSVDRDNNRKEYTFVERPAQARIIIDDAITVSFRPVDGVYPSYWSVIPASSSYQMTIDRRAMTKSLDRLALFQSSNDLMVMHISDTALRLNTEDKDFQMDGEELLACTSTRTDAGSLHSGQDFLRIGMAIHTVSSTLKALTSQQVAFSFVDASRAVLIHPVPQPDVEEITMLLMPMLIND